MRLWEIGGLVGGLLEDYGVGVPFVLAAAGAACAYSGGYGILGWHSMTAHGKFGTVVLVALSAVFVALAGFMYANLDKTDWLKTEEQDAQRPIEFVEGDDE